MFIIAGVQMWLGLTAHDGCDGALRPIKSICGLRLGDGLIDDGEAFGSEPEGEAESVPRLRLATSLGVALEAFEGGTDHPGPNEGGADGVNVRAHDDPR